ncbi:hypothetical protein IAG44_39030 [Streptomyces roseirectus]|uniref:Uncharacterized protein n=1 Tax=Streptomyces roseirectus TaxID=2768066 RepID=A0A7H0IPZ0_9ACTN|nr:hypothetical protein [Streptomyces roseirectus]QNP74856.1 hypothetical protein IAG44_39030 [Streptomyces roseirectus]
MSASPQHPARDTIPIGDVELHDHYLPALPAGDYRIEATHALRTGPEASAQAVGGTFRAVQRFTVRAPQVAVDTTAVVARQPPDSSEGRFAEVLPHLVLGDPMLPWERELSGADRSTPWLALLVLTDDQLIGGTASPTRAESTTVGAFLADDPDVLKPAPPLESDVKPDDPCEVIRIPAAVFPEVTPRLAELPYLAHCRGANTGDRPILGIQEDGLFAVLVAHRFPAAEPPGSPPQDRTKNIVHLVSLEGHEPLLGPGAPDFRGRTSVALLSLCSWSFWAHPDGAAHFRALAEGLTLTPDSSRAATREEMWLRLPSPYRDGDGTPAARRQVARRLGDGYVPLPYRTRSGERTFGWYRGPLTPVLPAPVDRVATATSADALLAYDPAWGSFDVSLATAFETGRSLALADAAYVQHLIAFKRATHDLVDTLYHQDTSSHLPAGDGNSSARAAFGALLDGPLLSTLGAAPAQSRDPWSPPAPEPVPGDPSEELTAFLNSGTVRTAVTRALHEDTGLRERLTPVVDWLARLLLLIPVPFTRLVPDARMLPPESLRFFHTDPNWRDALIGGALGIGAQSSRDTVQDEIVAAVVRAEVAEAAARHRDTLRDAGPDDPKDPGDPGDPGGSLGTVSGLLLRSALVSGWPHLAVRAVDAAGVPLPVLRMEHLSSSVLLCLFNGVPATVELAEPQEGFRFGVEDDGRIPLRSLLPDAGPRLPLGEQLGTDVTFDVLRHLRPSADPNVRVLDVGSLVTALGGALDRAHGTSVGTVGPADLALQLVKVPEAIRFDGPDGDRFPATGGDPV